MKTGDVRNHFNLIASSYDRYKRKNAFYYSTLKKAIFENIEKKEDVSILDIGCGTGDILAYLRPKRGLGVDISSRMVFLARNKHNEKSLSFRVHDIEKSSIAGQFDYILLTDVVEHLVHPGKVFGNIYQSMKDATRLILTMANPMWEPALMILEKLNLKMPEGAHRRIDETELRRLLYINHLEILNRKSYIPTLPIQILDNLSLMFVYIIGKRNE